MQFTKEMSHIVNESHVLSGKIVALLNAHTPDTLTAYLAVASVLTNLVKKLPPDMRADVIGKLFKQLRKD